MENNLMELINGNHSPAQLINSDQVANRFKKLYKTIHGIKSDTMSDAFYAAEQFHFLKLVSDNQNLQSCTKLSLYGIFMDVAVSGLSFDPSMKHLYIVPFNTNTGTRENPKWEKRAALQISGYGELLLRQLQGQVKYADNPVLVYEGDEFRFGSKDGKTILDHIACIPRKSPNIIAAYLKITRHDDTIDYKVMSMDEIQNLRKFSKDGNSKAWTDGLAGMVAAKVIKHAFKNYPKLRIGEMSHLHSQVVDETHEEVIDYGVTMALPESEAEFETATQPEPQPTQQQLASQQQEYLEF